MSAPEFEGYEKFFDQVGDDYLHPKTHGECYWPVSIEELYQHFKARLLAEMAAPEQKPEAQ